MISDTERFLSENNKSNNLHSILLVLLFTILLIITYFGYYLISGLYGIDKELKQAYSPELVIVIIISVLIILSISAGLIILLKRFNLHTRNIALVGEKELKISERKYKAVIEHSPVAIVQYDENLIITEYNKEFELLVRTKRAALKGEHLTTLFSKDFIEVFQKSIYGIEKVYEGWHNNPERPAGKYLLVSAAPVRDENNHQQFGVAILQDITGKKTSEKELIKANRYYKLSSKSNSSLLKAKTDFQLIENICSVFVKDGGYASATVLFINDLNRNEFRRIYSTGDSQIDLLFSERFNNNLARHSPFITSAKLNKTITFYPDELFENGSKEFGVNKTIVLPLNGTGTVVGLLVLQVEKSVKMESDEFSLINEIAGDLAFGLSKFEMESRHFTVKNVLYEVEEKFKKLISSTDDIIFMLDRGKKYQAIYGRWIDKSGIDPRKFLGKAPIQIFGYEDGKVHDNAANKAIEGENVSYEWTYSGAVRKYYFITTLSAIYDENGEVSEIIGISKNITEIKESSLALEKEHLRNKIYLNSTSDGFIMYNSNEEILEHNLSFYNMVGGDEVEIKNSNLRKFFPDYEKSEFFLKNKLIKTGESFLIEMYLLQKNGNLLPVEISTSKIEYADKEAYISSIRDLRYRKESEEKLKLLSKAIENSPVGVMITDSDATIRYVNNRYEEITGYNFEELSGKNPRIIKSGSTPLKVYEQLWNNLTVGKEWSGELLNKKKNGQLYWEKVLISPMIDAKGNTTHYVAIKEDISREKEMERILIEAKEKAEEMNRLKSNFLANMSHELRTPMIGILGYSELLKSELTDSPELYDLASVIYRGGNRLMETLNLILDLSRIESGNLEISNTPVELNSLIKESIQLYDETAKQKHLFLKHKCITSKICIVTDPRLLTLAINNLINNAIKFTKAGGVVVSSKTEQIQQQYYAVITVCDTGIGIPKDKQSIIFNEFRQVSEGYSRSFEGTGLGLTLTKKAVEILKGTISVDSEIGVGSTFKIRIPINIEQLSETDNNESAGFYS